MALKFRLPFTIFNQDALSIYHEAKDITFSWMREVFEVGSELRDELDSFLCESDGAGRIRRWSHKLHCKACLPTHSNLKDLTQS